MTFQQWQADFAAGRTTKMWAHVARDMSPKVFSRATVPSDAHTANHVSMFRITLPPNDPNSPGDDGIDSMLAKIRMMQSNHVKAKRGH